MQSMNGTASPERLTRNYFYPLFVRRAEASLKEFESIFHSFSIYPTFLGHASGTTSYYTTSGKLEHELLSDPYKLAAITRMDSETRIASYGLYSLRCIIPKHYVDYTPMEVLAQHSVEADKGVNRTTLCNMVTALKSSILINNAKIGENRTDYTTVRTAKDDGVIFMDIPNDSNGKPVIGITFERLYEYIGLHRTLNGLGAGERSQVLMTSVEEAQTVNMSSRAVVGLQSFSPYNVMEKVIDSDYKISTASRLYQFADAKDSWRTILDDDAMVVEDGGVKYIHRNILIVAPEAVGGNLQINNLGSIDPYAEDPHAKYLFTSGFISTMLRTSGPKVMVIAVRQLLSSVAPTIDPKTASELKTITNEEWKQHWTNIESGKVASVLGSENWKQQEALSSASVKPNDDLQKVKGNQKESTSHSDKLYKSFKEGKLGN